MRRIALLALAVMLGMAAVITAAPAQALGKFLCAPVGRAQVDPIVQHGTAPSMHNHLFLGNTALLGLPRPESATYADLAGKGTSCDNPDDTGAYWVPDLVFTNTGQSAQNKRLLAYYRSFDHKTTGTAEPIPADLRMVAGNAAQPASVPLDVRNLNWTCDERSSRTGPFRSIEEANCSTAGGIVYLTAHVDFPTCWDGQFSPRGDGNTSDMPHLRFAAGSTCPAGFGHKLAELRETIKWGDGTAAYWKQGPVALTSDLMQRDAGNPVASGQTLHADFWNTWVQSGGVHGGMEGMVAQCINSSGKPAWCNS